MKLFSTTSSNKPSRYFFGKMALTPVIGGALISGVQNAYAVTPFIGTAPKTGHGGYMQPNFVVVLIVVLIVLGAVVYAAYLAGQALSASQKQKIQDYEDTHGD